MQQSVRRRLNSQSEKKRGNGMFSSNDSPMPSKAVKELIEKCKRRGKKVQSLELRECRRSPGGKLLVSALSLTKGRRQGYSIQFGQGRYPSQKFLTGTNFAFSNLVAPVMGKGSQKAQPAEHGENLVGKSILVWWPADKMFYEGVVESFDSGTKEHKVSYDDGEEEIINLKEERWELVENVSHILDSLADEAIDVGKKLVQLPSSTAEIINILAEVEQILYWVKQSPSRLVIKALDQIIATLIAKELLIHPDVDVNISVACCICDVLTFMTPYNHEQMKEFFQLVVVTFEKLTSTCGGYYTKMMKVLDTLSSVKFMERMSGCLQLDGLLVRLFQQFLTVADSNSSAVVSKMEQIMTLIMGESKDVDELAELLTTSVKKNDQIALPVSCQLGEKVLKNCAARLCKPHRPDMSVRRCQNSQSEKKRGKYMLLSDDPPMPSKAVKELNGKRKRNDKKVRVAGKVSSSQSDMICVQGYMVKNSNAPILKAIFRSHGDIAAKCVFTNAAVRASLLEAVCEIVDQVNTNDVTNIIAEMEDIESRVSAAEGSKINVSWLRAHLETILERNEAQKTVTLLMEMKTNTSLVKKAAGTDLKDKYDNLVAAQNQLEEAKRCVKVLDLVEKKLSKDVLEFKDLLVGQPILYVD